MATEASNSNAVDGDAAAKSYVGSVISLTSKSDIRYQGTLSDLDATQATIGLRNVRSFGTEGRRKDGPQVPATDKVYEYIAFRGSDIKDLQVKAGPPGKTAPSAHNDPAIIRSRFIPSTVPSSLPTLPATATQTGGSLSDVCTQIPQSRTPINTYQNSTPLYHAGGGSASWNASPSSTSNSSVVSGPMYLPGYSGPSASVQSQQQPLFQSVQGLPVPSSLLPPLAQQQILYTNANSSFPTRASNILASQSMEFHPPLQHIIDTTESLSSTVLPAQLSALTVDSSSVMVSKAPLQAVLVVSQSTNSSSTSSDSPSIPGQPKAIFNSPMPSNSSSEPLSSVAGSTDAQALVTPGQFLQPVPTITQTPLTAPKDVEVVHVPGEPATSAETRAPSLHLPSPVNPEFSNFEPNYTEEFDFEAMNERFKKDEVWRDLSRNLSKKSDAPNRPDEADIDVQGPDKKPIYKKDDFFDTLSNNALDRESGYGRTRFSERLRVDTQTFGAFPRDHGFQGGRGSNHGGRSRGGFHGRGYGYGERGRGRGQNEYRGF
ncbi:hypothetical protein vseg_005508 [Gypsophila vaccaria]